MASKNVTFDPDAGVPYAANLTIYGGSTFSATYNVTDTSNAAFDFSGSNAVGIATTTGWTGSAQMSKSVAVGATLGVTTTFTVGFTSAAGGVFNISLGSTDTNNLTQGRYGLGGAANNVRGAFMGGHTTGDYVNTVDYITIATTGNATDLCDINGSKGFLGGGFTGEV